MKMAELQRLTQHIPALQGVELQQWLQAQLALVNPRLVVCLGRVAATALIRPDFRITREHGQWFSMPDGRRWMAIYHPSALLRDVSKRPETFVDLKLLQRTIRAECERTL